MKKHSVLVVVFFLGLMPSALNAQSDAPAIGNIYGANHWTFELQTSYNSIQFQNVVGNENMPNKPDDFRLLMAGYQFNFGEHFGLKLHVGVGNRPFLSLLDLRRNLLNNSQPNFFFFLLRPVPFGRVGLSSSYHKQFNKSKWGLDASAGGSIAFYSNVTSWTEIGIIEDAGQIVPFFISPVYQNRAVFIADASIGITRLLHNKNLLGLYLVGEYHFGSMFTGTYNFQDSPSNGLILNNGTNIGFKLKYSFTGKKRNKGLKK